MLLLAFHLYYVQGCITSSMAITILFYMLKGTVCRYCFLFEQSRLISACIELYTSCIELYTSCIVSNNVHVKYGGLCVCMIYIRMCSVLVTAKKWLYVLVINSIVVM